MKKEQIIFAGLGLIALDTACKLADITYTDPVFWYVMVPIALVIGGATRKLCN